MVDRRELTEVEKRAAQNLRNKWAGKKSSLGLSQQRAAEILGMTQGAVNQYLNARIPLNYEAVHKFARLLSVPPETISEDICGHTLFRIEQKIVEPPKIGSGRAVYESSDLNNAGYHQKLLLSNLKIAIENNALSDQDATLLNELLSKLIRPVD